SQISPEALQPPIPGLLLITIAPTPDRILGSAQLHPWLNLGCRLCFLLLIVTLLYVLAGQSSVAEAACLAKGHLCVSFRQCCSGYCLPINASNRWPDRPSSSALTTALTTEAAPWKGNLKCWNRMLRWYSVSVKPGSTAFTVTVEPSAATGIHPTPRLTGQPLAQLPHEHHLEELALRVALLRIEVLQAVVRRCQSTSPFSAFLQVTKHDSGLRRQPALLEHEPGQQVVAEVVHAQVRLHPVIGEGRLGRQLHDAGVQHQGVHAGVGQVALDELAHGLVAGQVQLRAAHLRVHRPVANVVGNVVAFLQVPAGQDHCGAPLAKSLAAARPMPWVAPVTTTCGHPASPCQSTRRPAHSRQHNGLVDGPSSRAMKVDMSGAVSVAEFNKNSPGQQQEVAAAESLAGMRKTSVGTSESSSTAEAEESELQHMGERAILAVTDQPLGGTVLSRNNRAAGVPQLLGQAVPQQGEQLASALLVNHRVVLQAAGLRLAAQGEVRDEQQVARQVAHRRQRLGIASWQQAEAADLLGDVVNDEDQEAPADAELLDLRLLSLELLSSSGGGSSRRLAERQRWMSRRAAACSAQGEQRLCITEYKDT
uniref:SMB domain-containing protein n=1 Tax=Macrostomum lignano TaxID=282301 RepID=A0A1I8JS09_9PLAT